MGTRGCTPCLSAASAHGEQASRAFGTFEVVEPSAVGGSPNPKTGSGDLREKRGHWTRNQPTEQNHEGQHDKDGCSPGRLNAFQQQATETADCGIPFAKGSSNPGIIRAGIVGNRTARSFEAGVGQMGHRGQNREDKGKESNAQLAKEAMVRACWSPSWERGSSGLVNHRTTPGMKCVFLLESKASTQTASLSIGICTGFR